MAKLSDFTRGESKYLRADDLEPNEKVPLYIDNVIVDAVKSPDSGKLEQKAIVYFKGYPARHADKNRKGLILNSTNGETLTSAYGDTIEDQQNKPVLLYRTTTSFGRKTVPCLRLEIPDEFSEPATETPKPVDGDDIPF